MLDLRPPDRSGHDVPEAVRADPATRLLPVVMMTGYATSAERARAQAEGVTDFVPRHFSPHELLPRVRVLVTPKQFADEHERAERVILALPGCRDGDVVEALHGLVSAERQRA